jgi:hypothetical protein
MTGRLMHVGTRTRAVSRARALTHGHDASRQRGARRYVLVGLVVLMAPGGCGAPESDRAGTAADTSRQGTGAVADDTSPGPITGDARGPEPDGARLPEGPADTAGAWTIGPTRVEREPTAVATLVAVRTARNDGFDRVVLDFGRGPVPSYRIAYIDRPVRQCGSGDPVPVAGDGWLSIEVEPARAHTEEGQATIDDRRRSPDLPVLAALVLTCDFEAQVEWVAGVRSPEPYRVLELGDPSRLVVDIRHPAPR